MLTSGSKRHVIGDGQRVASRSEQHQQQTASGAEHAHGKVDEEEQGASQAFANHGRSNGEVLPGESGLSV